MKHFNGEKLLFPHRPLGGPHKGELHWKSLKFSQVLNALHNPRYAGAFAYGRSRRRRRPGGGVEHRRLAREEWTVLLRDAHPGYIAWNRFEENERQLRDNAQSYEGKRRSPPREGPALLQGLAICGLCGRNMTVRYHTRKGRQYPEYVCSREGIETASAKCQSIPGAAIDRTVAPRGPADRHGVPPVLCDNGSRGLAPWRRPAAPSRPNPGSPWRAGGGRMNARARCPTTPGRHVATPGTRVRSAWPVALAERGLGNDASGAACGHVSSVPVGARKRIVLPR